MKKLVPFGSEKSKLASAVTAKSYLSTILAIPEEELHKVAPSKVILCLERGLYDSVKPKCKRSQHHPLPGNLVLLPGSPQHEVGVCGDVGVGGPSLALLVEDLIAMGAKEIICIGTAGLLIGQGREKDQEYLYVCQQAVRDEGTSRHYLEEGLPALASTSLTEKILDTFVGEGIKAKPCLSWTTDAPYRETISEVRYYAGLGVKTVDMEAATLFSVAANQDVDLALCFTISDAFIAEKWSPYYDSSSLKIKLSQLFSAAAITFGVRDGVS